MHHLLFQCNKEDKFNHKYTTIVRIVQKFGGTSVADINKIKSVAQKIKTSYDQGIESIVVVSAMAGVTNQLVRYLTEVSEVSTETAEHDAVLSSGEQVSAGLLAITLCQMGVPAQSLLSWQVPIKTDGNHMNARIQDISNITINALLSSKVIPIVAGFQGISSHGRLTTLGRGGSDTSAVGLAAYCDAERCDIYTDVEGVYTADPRLVPTALKLDEISYDQMLTLAAEGAKVLQEESVRLAQKFKVPVQVLSSFTDSAGTLMKEALDKDRPVTGIAHKLDLCQLITNSTPGLFIPMGNLEKTINTLNPKSYKIIDNIAKLTIVGQPDLSTQQQRITSLLNSLNIVPLHQVKQRSSLTLIMARHHIETAIQAIHQELFY